METVDPIDQLAMSLKWEEDYSEEYKRRVLIEAMRFVAERKDLVRIVFPMKRPTIAELEAILHSEEDTPIVIQPDGSISTSSLR